ncbi:MAG: restriction endonuclease subunit S [Enhygromyxa sp.]
MSRPHPDNWEIVRFGDVVDIRSDLVDPATMPNAAHIAPNHIESGTGRLLAYQTVEADGVTSSKHRFFPGQVLYSKIRPYLAKAVLVDFPGLCSADMYPLSTNLDPGFLLRWILTPTFTARVSQDQGRTVLPKINQAALAEVPVPVPPLNEQKRIVAKIEELTTRSRRAKEALDAVPALLDKLRQSILAAAFRGDLTADWRAKNPSVEPADQLGDESLPAGWGRVRLGETVQGLDQGWSPKCINEARSSDEQWAVMKTTAVQPGRFVPAENKILPASLKPRQAAELHAGDLLITRAGPRSRAGVCCLVRHVPPRLMACDKVYRFRADRTIILPEYLELVLNGPGALHALEIMKTGISDSGVNLTRMKFLEMLIPVAPLPEQREIVARAEAAFRACEHEISHQISALSAEIATLDQSILAKAFRGELVPQDPTDEPASVLLERIRAAREAAPPKKTRRTRKPKPSTQPPKPKRSKPAQTPTPDPPRRPAQLSLDVDALDLEAELFAALWLLGPLDKDAAVRAVAEHLRERELVSFQRLRKDGSLYAELLAAIEAAVKAGRLDRPKRGQVRACKRSAGEYTIDDWREALVHSLTAEAVHQEDAVAQAAEWARDMLGLEFKRLRTDGKIAKGLRSAINSAIRRGLVVREGRKIRLV